MNIDRTKRPGGLKRPGPPRTHAHANNGGANNGVEARRPADGIIYVIYTFGGGEEGFNGISSIKTDIYFAPGCVWFAANSIL